MMTMIIIRITLTDVTDPMISLRCFEVTSWSRSVLPWFDIQSKEQAALFPFGAPLNCCPNHFPTSLDLLPRLPFRLTVREYGTDICYTPMILADSFMHSAKARDLEFQSCPAERGPIVVQFAARTAHEFASAYALVAPWVDGVDLNCGCPQGWAMAEGIGAGLMRSPQLIADMVRAARSVGGLMSPPTPISVKMRIFEERKKTVELAQAIEAAGAAWITVHGRTRHQKSSEPVDYDTIALVRQAVHIPVIANGDVTSLAMAQHIQERTGVHGVMSARGLLENPALFAGYENTPQECLKRFIEYSLEYGTSGTIFQHHLAKMIGNGDKMIQSVLSNASIPTLLDYLRAKAKEGRVERK